ncbi:hypothetical protein [Novosphingobium sp.]|jgi:hypothetical protein|uniref:hypothetical protein n=1 Tax=Novosphingobium sp. TaxID=1874826 RepID=UPI002FE242B9
MIGREGAADIVALLDGAPLTCTEIAARLGLPVADVAGIAGELWARKLLQGEVGDGCCQDPCSASCIVAGSIDRRWRLSRKGQSALRHWRAGVPDA